MSVAAAADPIIALQKMKRTRPDVIVLDLEMPRMDGLTFLRQLMAEDPMPVVVCSSLTGAGRRQALRALEEGAVDIVTKPQGRRARVPGRVRDRCSTDGASAAAATARLARRRPPRRRRRTPVRRRRSARRRAAAHARERAEVVAIGASTGGTEAMREILEAHARATPRRSSSSSTCPSGSRARSPSRLDATCAAAT